MSMTDSIAPEKISALRLWQLISPQLPVGAYAYSQALEYANSAGWVDDETSAFDWIQGQIDNTLSMLDIPVLLRLQQGWSDNNIDSVKKWNEFLLASRESSELLAEDLHLGWSLYKILTDLDVKDIELWPSPDSTSFASMFALAASHWTIPPIDSAQGYLWSWCENQVTSAIKLIPLGQTAGQRMLSNLIEPIARNVQKSLTVEDDDIGALAPAIAIASALHETQYTRLFRS